MIEKFEGFKYWINASMLVYCNIQVIIMAVYRSPNCTETEFCDAFEEAIEEISVNNNDIIIADFNIGWSQVGVYKIRISNIINDSFFKTNG